MLFKFLEKPIEITAFVPSVFSFVIETAPVSRSSNIIPNWWKNTPKSSTSWTDNGFEIYNTTKNCMGIIGTFQNGYIIPMWCDLALKINSNEFWQYQFSDNKSKLMQHKNSQAPDFFSDHFIFKIETPWMFSFSENINLMMLDPFYHFTKKREYLTPYGITPTINKILPLSHFIFLEKKPAELFVSFRTPLLHLIPLTEKRTSLKLEVITHEEYDKIKSKTFNTQFVRRGLNLIKLFRS